MQESDLLERLRSVYPNLDVHLVLGHSHEVRHSTLSGSGEPLRGYLDSGAAGRFENLRARSPSPQTPAPHWLEAVLHVMMA